MRMEKETLFRRDLPYPDPAKIVGNCREGRRLTGPYAGRESEMTALCQYMYQSILLREAIPELARTLEGIGETEMRHMDLLGQAIAACGSEPRLLDCTRERDLWWSGAWPDPTTDPAGMLLRDLSDERRAVRTYERLAAETENAQIASLLRRIAADEELHVEILERAYAELVGGEKTPRTVK